MKQKHGALAGPLWQTINSGFRWTTYRTDLVASGVDPALGSRPWYKAASGARSPRRPRRGEIRWPNHDPSGLRRLSSASVTPNICFPMKWTPRASCIAQ
jgi:hypothetical protein